jgi:hypothetical protein
MPLPNRGRVVGGLSPRTAGLASRYTIISPEERILKKTLSSEGREKLHVVEIDISQNAVLAERPVPFSESNHSSTPPS